MAGEDEKRLYDATKRGDLATVQDVLQKDPYLLDGASFAYSRNLLHIATMWEQEAIVEDLLGRNPKLAEDLDSNSSSPLHIAVAKGNFEIASKLLVAAPEMCGTRDSQGMNPIHIAAAKGNLQIASKLLAVAPEMCWSLDCQGMNPIHIAAKNGQVEILEHLLGENPSPAMKRLNCGGTVLHLCVKHGQLRTFKVLVEKYLSDLVHATDDNGDTVLHMAVRCNQLEMVRYLAKNTNIFVTANNSMEYSPMGILEEMPPNDTTVEIRQVLARSMRSFAYALNPNSRARDAIIVVLALIATVAFQAIVNPPGGVWQDDSSTHKAGEAVMSYNRPNIYKLFIFFNTVAFGASLIAIVMIIPIDASIIKITSVISMIGFISALFMLGLSYGASLLMILRIPVRQTADTLIYGYVGIVFFLSFTGGALLMFYRKRKQRH